jgi:UDP-2,4-diacetamido-2,4,6-trideoxy-beta-L-altropyranose hydrolase
MAAQKLELVVRADAGPDIGAGHLLRCLALAQACRSAGGDAIFIADAGAHAERIKAERFRHVPVARDAGIEPALELLSAHTGAWCVLDGYDFTSDDQRRLRNAARGLLVIDDIAHLDRYEADVVLNQNLGAENLSYACASQTRLLLGPRYVLLRREFLAKERSPPQADARHVLVTLGGGEQWHALEAVLEAVALLADETLDVAVTAPAGVGAPEREHAVEFVTGAAMPELLAWADVAVSAAGTTSWELAYMGVPALLLALAPNQRAVAAGLTRAGAALDARWEDDPAPARLAQQLERLLADASTRLRMSGAGRALVDGKGASRALRALETTTVR